MSTDEPCRPERVKTLADIAAHEAVKNVFTLFGVDVEDQTSVNCFRSDLVYARKMRRASEKVGIAMIWAIVGGAVVVVGTIFVTGFKRWLGIDS